MIRLLISFSLILYLAIPVSALEILPPEVPFSAKDAMPENTTSFWDGLVEILEYAVHKVRPELADAAGVCISVIAAVLILAILEGSSDQIARTANFSGTLVVSSVLISSTNAMITLGTNTLQSLSDYGKLLFPVMTAAMAAQGGIATSAALYTGTVVFDLVLNSFLTNLLVPLVYLFLALSVANSAVGEDILKKFRDMIKNGVNWLLKMILTIFTSYMSITGVVSGTTDAAALKATKLTISSVVPVIGGILADASESVLISAGVMKNSAGLYGIFALLAILVEPFLRIGSQYLILKATGTVSGLIGSKEITGLIDDFSSAMGLLLAMTGASCLLMLISTVCFMKGIG